MSEKEKKRTSILKRKSSIGGQNSDDPDASKTGKKIFFSTKKSVKEFHCDEHVKSMWVWDTSYEESANCHTASDQGDTQVPNLTDMQQTTVPLPILTGPNKENIAVDVENMTILGATLENLEDGPSIESLEFSLDENSFYQKHAYKSPCRKIAKPRYTDMSLVDNGKVRRTDFSEVAMVVEEQNKGRRRSPRLQEAEKNRQTTFEANMDVTTTVNHSVRNEHKSKIPLFVASPARKKPRTTLHEPSTMDFSGVQVKFIESNTSLDMSIEAPLPEKEIFKKPSVPLSRTISLPKEMEMNKENISALFDHEAVNNTVCVPDDMDFEVHEIKNRKTITTAENIEMTFMSPTTFGDKLDQLQFGFNDLSNPQTLKKVQSNRHTDLESSVNMSIESFVQTNEEAAVQNIRSVRESTYEPVAMNHSKFETEGAVPKFNEKQLIGKYRPTIFFENENIHPEQSKQEVKKCIPSRKSIYESVDMDQSCIDAQETATHFNGNQLTEGSRKEAGRPTIFFQDENIQPEILPKICTSSRKSSYESVDVDQSCIDAQESATHFNGNQLTEGSRKEAGRPTIFFQGENIQPVILPKICISSRKSCYESVDMNQSDVVHDKKISIEDSNQRRPTICFENSAELNIHLAKSTQQQGKKHKQRNTIIFSNENSLDMSQTAECSHIQSTRVPFMDAIAKKPLQHFSRPTIHECKDISVEYAESEDLQKSELSKAHRQTIEYPKNVSMDIKNSTIIAPKNVSLEHANIPDTSMSTTLKQYLKLEQENMSMDINDTRAPIDRKIYPTQNLTLENKSPRGSVIDQKAKEKSVQKLTSHRRTILDAIDISIEKTPIPLPRRAFQPIKEQVTRRTLLDHKAMDSSSVIAPRKQNKIIETEAIKPTRPKPVRRTVYDNQNMDVSLLPEVPIITKQKHKTVCEPDDLDISGISIDDEELKKGPVIKDVKSLQESDAMELDNEPKTTTISNDILDAKAVEQSLRKSDPMDLDETLQPTTCEISKSSIAQNNDNNVPDLPRRRGKSTVNDMLRMSIMNRTYEKSKRTSTALLEQTSELVQNLSLLDEVNPPSTLPSLSDRDSTELKMCSYGNLTFETLSASSRDTSKTDDSRLSKHDSCLSCSILEESCVATPKSRLSLSDPMLEQIRQRALKSEPIFVFCKDCQCSKNDVVPKLDEVENLLDFSALRRVVEQRTKTISEIQEQHKQRMRELEISQEPNNACYPETPSLKFLYENWKEQMNETVKQAEEHFLSQYVRCPAPFPKYKDELFLIKNKIKSENFPWKVHRSVFFHEGLFHMHHNELKSVQILFQIKSDYIATNGAFPSMFEEIKLLPYRTRPPKTTFAIIVLKEFLKHFSFGQSLVYRCNDMSKFFNFLESLDQEFTQCLNIVQRLFSILNDNNMFIFIESDVLYATRKLFRDATYEVSKVTINLADVDHLTPLNIVTSPYVNLSEKLGNKNLTGMPLLEHFLSNIESLVFS